jgi:hypothetical protein
MGRQSLDVRCLQLFHNNGPFRFQFVEHKLAFVQSLLSNQPLFIRFNLVTSQIGNIGKFGRFDASSVQSNVIFGGG